MLQKEDLVQKSKEQVDVFMNYLPKQLSDEELETGMKEIITEVEATTLKDMEKLWVLLLKICRCCRWKKNK